MRAPFTYYGGKTGMSHLIAGLMPAHRVYIEPFFGSGAVFFAKTPAAVEIVNDLDDGIVTFFRVLRDRPDHLERVCRLTPYARAEYDATKDLGATYDDLERARRFWVRVNQSFAKTAGRHTGWSVTTARTQSTANSVLGRLDRFEACARRLMATVVEHCDAAGLVERLATANTLIYADPPYLAETRAGQNKRPGDYTHDMGTEDEHRRLAEVLHATPATVILSGYPSCLYDELYGDWWRREIPGLVHSSNAVIAARGERTEVLWANRDLDTGLFAATEAL